MRVLLPLVVVSLLSACADATAAPTATPIPSPRLTAEQAGARLGEYLQWRASPVDPQTTCSDWLWDQTGATPEYIAARQAWRISTTKGSTPEEVAKLAPYLRRYAVPKITWLVDDEYGVVTSSDPRC